MVVRVQQRGAEETKEEDGAHGTNAIVTASNGAGLSKPRVDGAADGGEEAAKWRGALES